MWTPHEFITLVDKDLDNYIFGVASVNPDGFESPVVFPGPAGEFSIEFEDDTDDN